MDTKYKVGDIVKTKHNKFSYCMVKSVDNNGLYALIVLRSFKWKNIKLKRFDLLFIPENEILTLKPSDSRKCYHEISQLRSEMIEYIEICSNVMKHIDMHFFDSFDDFLSFIRKEIGNYCNDTYWHDTYENLDTHMGRKCLHRTRIANLAVNAIATDSSSKS